MGGLVGNRAQPLLRAVPARLQFHASEVALPDALGLGDATSFAMGFFKGMQPVSCFAGLRNLVTGRGRDDGYPSPPAQIRTCRITAPYVGEHILCEMWRLSICGVDPSYAAKIGG